MHSFLISHSSCAEQYGDMSSDTHTHTHTIKPPTAGVQLVGHTSINIILQTAVRLDKRSASSAYSLTDAVLRKTNNILCTAIWFANFVITNTRRSE